MTSKLVFGQVPEVLTLTELTPLILGSFDPTVLCYSYSRLPARLTSLQANAQVLFHRESDLKIVTAQASSGVLYYSALVSSDPKSASVHKVSLQRV